MMPVALVRTDISEQLIASIIRVERISDIWTTLAVTSNVLLRSVLQLLVTANVVLTSTILSILMMEAIPSSEKLVLARAPRRHIPEEAILHSCRRENLKSYLIVLN
jgi:hypothetical protein